MAQVTFSFETSGCHYTGENLIMVGDYTGTKTVRTIEWYFDKQVAGNIIVLEADCSTFGRPPSGYPSDRMTYSCDNATHTYKATISNLDGTEAGEWGVRFSFTDSSVSQVSKSSFSLCQGNSFCKKCAFLLKYK